MLDSGQLTRGLRACACPCVYMCGVACVPPPPASGFLFIFIGKRPQWVNTTLVSQNSAKILFHKNLVVCGCSAVHKEQRAVRGLLGGRKTLNLQEEIPAQPFLDTFFFVVQGGVFDSELW